MWISAFYSFSQDLSLSSHFTQSKAKVVTMAYKDPCHLILQVTSWPHVLLQLFLSLLYLWLHRPTCQFFPGWRTLTSGRLFLAVLSAGNILRPDSHTVYFLIFIQILDQMSSSQWGLCSQLHLFAFQTSQAPYPSSIASIGFITFQYTILFSYLWELMSVSPQ